MMLCDLCTAHQNDLMEAGDGSQVFCTHMENFGVSDKEQSPKIPHDDSATTFIDRQIGSESFSSSTSAGKKRHFPSLKEFTDASEDKVKRKLRPLQKWNSLTPHVVYFVKKVVSIDVGGNGISDKGYYAELENRNEECFNVWLTDIIKNELDMYNVCESDVYIIPLGMKKCKESGNSFFDFVVQAL
jgi:hypothetical protein